MRVVTVAYRYQHCSHRNTWSYQTISIPLIFVMAESSVIHSEVVPVREMAVPVATQYEFTESFPYQTAPRGVPQGPTETPSNPEIPSTSRSFSSLRSGRSRRSSRSRDSTTRAQNRVVYATDAQYDDWTKSILSVPVILISIRLALVYAKDANIASFERSQTVWILSWTLLLILGLYMMVLPKQLSIRSNGSLGVKTSLLTYEFADVCHLYQAEDVVPNFMGKSYRLGTSLGSPPMVLRRRNLWDVVVTPVNATEFLQSFESVLTRLEIQRASSKNGPGDASANPKDEPPMAVVTATFV